MRARGIDSGKSSKKGAGAGITSHADKKRNRQRALGLGDVKRDQTDDPRNKASYKKFRAYFLKRRPLCQDPFTYHREDGKHVPSQEVHHIDQVSDSPSLVREMGNCLAVCTKCHAKLSAMERTHQTDLARALAKRAQSVNNFGD